MSPEDGCPSGPLLRLLWTMPSLVPYAAVARAEQIEPGRSVEFRILPEGLSPELGALFHQELKELGRLDHPGFLPVLSEMKIEGRPAYILPFRQHPSLASLVRESEGAFSLEERIQVLESLAGALSRLHLQNLSLGPVSPERIFWDVESRVAYFRHHKPVPADWEQGLLCHSPLVDRLPPGQADDVLYWGLLAFWLVTGGQVAYGAGPEDPRSLAPLCPRLPESVRLITESALSWDPEGRPRNGPELHSLLRMDRASWAGVRVEPGAETSPGEVSREISRVVRGKVRELEVTGRIPRAPPVPETAPWNQENLHLSSSELHRAFLAKMAEVEPETVSREYSEGSPEPPPDPSERGGLAQTSSALREPLPETAPRDLTWGIPGPGPVLRSPSSSPSSSLGRSDPGGLSPRPGVSVRPPGPAPTPDAPERSWFFPVLFGGTLLAGLGAGLLVWLGETPDLPRAPTRFPVGELVARGRGEAGRGRPAPPARSLELAPVSRVLREGHGDVSLQELLSHRDAILPEDFEPIWKKLQSLVVRKVIPGGKEEGRKLMRLFIRFKREPRAACKELEVWIARLRKRYGQS